MKYIKLFEEFVNEKYEITSDSEYYYLIHDVQEIPNGIKVIFRTYSRNESGGYKQTWWLKGNVNMNNYKMFLGAHPDKSLMKDFGVELHSKKTDNKVSKKFQYQNVEKYLK